jgi:hypothetical protein
MKDLIFLQGCIGGQDSVEGESRNHSKRSLPELNMGAVLIRMFQFDRVVSFALFAYMPGLH